MSYPSWPENCHAQEDGGSFRKADVSGAFLHVELSAQGGSLQTATKESKDSKDSPENWRKFFLGLLVNVTRSTLSRPPKQDHSLSKITQQIGYKVSSGKRKKFMDLTRSLGPKS